MMVYICSKFNENILNGITVTELTLKVNRWTEGTTIRPVFDWHCLIVVCICTKFHENIFPGIKVIEGTRFSQEKFQRA